MHLILKYNRDIEEDSMTEMCSGNDFFIDNPTKNIQ